MATDDAPEPRRRAARHRWVLVVPVLGLAVPPLYNRHDPTLVGVPFFYAWQLLMIAVAAVCLLLVHRTDRRNADRQDRDR